MHEISIMQSVLEHALETAKASQAREILSLRLRIGRMSGVVPEALQFAFEALREGTIAGEAQLQVEDVSVSCWCKQCQVEFNSDDLAYQCPACGQLSAELRHGLEMELVSMEVN